VAHQVLADELDGRTPPSDQPEFMSIDTAAKYLDVSPERLRKLQARRRIPYYQEGIGCRVLFRRTDLDQWMATFRNAPTNESHDKPLVAPHMTHAGDLA